MKHNAFGNQLTPVLLAACALLGVIAALEWYALSDEAGIEPVGEELPAAATDARLTRISYMAPDAGAFSEIVERPLFTEGRTPPQAPATEQTNASPVKQTPLTLRLEGIALSPESRIVLVRDLTSNKLLRLAEGANHQGWVLEAIHPTGATFRRGGQSRELSLEPGKKNRGKTMIPGVLIPR